MSDDDAGAVLDRTFSLHQAGRVEEAEPLCRVALAENPDDAEAADGGWA